MAVSEHSHELEHVVMLLPPDMMVADWFPPADNLTFFSKVYWFLICPKANGVKNSE